MYYRSRSIVLKNMDLKETDKLVTIFSESQGKLKAVAKGVKKPNSSLRACVQPFCCSLLFFNGGRELDVITQGRLLDFYGNCREDINITLYIMYMMELLDKSLMDKVPLPLLFNTTIEILNFFNNKGFNILAVRYFEMKLLINLGYQPVIDRCVACNRKEVTAAGFDLSAGGILCRQCLPDKGHYIPMNGESIALARLLAAGRLTAITRVKVSPAAAHQLETFLEKYMEYYLERKFYMKNTIKTLKRTLGIPD